MKPIDDGFAPGRIRRVVAWTAIPTAAAAAVLASRGVGDDVLLLVLGFVGYLSAGFAVAHESRRVGSPMPPVHDVSLDRRRMAQLAVVAVTTFIVSVAALYLALIALSFPFGEWVTSTFLEPDEEVIPAGMIQRALFVVEVVALGPIVEELVFRGAMLHWWAKSLGVRRAVIVSAVLFGALHFDPLGSTLFAFVATALYMSTGSMLAPIVFHAIWNCAVTILEVATEGASSDTESLASLRAEWAPVAVALLVGGLVLHRTVRSLRPAEGWRLPALG